METVSTAPINHGKKKEQESRDKGLPRHRIKSEDKDKAIEVQSRARLLKEGQEIKEEKTDS
jgi:hypothetical protein